jgi:hypothetical protein
MAAAQYYDVVQEAYLAYYGRPADTAGLAYWANQLNNAGGDMSSIINAFGTSAESTALYGGSNTAAQISAIYETLFGRQPDTPGLNFYVNGISTGQFTLASVALNIYNGATGSDATQLAAKLAYADAFTAALQASGSAQVAYSGTVASNNARAAVAAVTDTTSEDTAAANLSTTLANINAGAVGQTITLTTGVDTLTGGHGDNVFNAVLGSNLMGASVATLNAFDSITGGSGTNTLNIADATPFANVHDVIPAGVTLSNIQNINLTTTGNAGTIGAQAIDVSGVSGLQSVTVESGGVYGDNIKAATTVNVTDTTGGAAVVTGGDAVSVTANVTGGAGDITVAGAVGAVSVADKGDAALISVHGGTTVDVTTAGGGDIHIGALPVLDNTGALSAATLAAAPTGNITVNESSTNADSSVSFGGGQALIYTNGATSVSLTGTANDTIADVQATPNAAATADVGTSTLASVTLDGVGSTVNINSDALTSLTVLDSDDANNASTSVVVNNNSTGDQALALTVGANLVTGVGTAAPTGEFVSVEDDNATSVSVATTGVLPTDLTLSAASATSLTFDNAAKVTLDANSTLSNVATITATGAGALNLGNVETSAAVFGSVTTVDASQSTGAVSVEIDGTQAFTGGAGGATVTLDGALTKTSGGSIAFGSGNNSLLDSGNGSIGNGVTVDGGVGGTNTISASLVNAGADIKDFQILDVSSFSGKIDATFALATPVSGVAVSTGDTGATLQDLANNVTVDYSVDDANGSSDLTLTHQSGKGTLTVNLDDQSAASNAWGTELALTSTGDTAVSFNSGGAKGLYNLVDSLSENDNHLSTVTITGSNQFELDAVHTNAGATTAKADVASSLTTIDASATTGGVDIVAGGSDVIGTTAYHTTYTGLTIKGGTGGDNIENDAANGVIVEDATAATTTAHNVYNTLTVTADGATINDAASAANDTINLEGTNGTAELGSGKVITVNVEDNATQVANDFTSITFGKGVATVNDYLDSTGSMLTLTNAPTHGSTLYLSDANTTLTAANVSGQTFANALANAAGANAGDVSWFQAGGATYVEVSDGNHGAAQLVKIVGNVDMTHVTLDAAGLHF